MFHREQQGISQVRHPKLLLGYRYYNLKIFKAFIFNTYGFHILLCMQNSDELRYLTQFPYTATTYECTMDQAL